MVRRSCRIVAALMAAVAVATTPALLSACLTLCLPGDMTPASPSRVPNARAEVAASVAPSGCAEHAPAAPAAGLRLGAASASCCDDEPGAGITAVAVSRLDSPVIDSPALAGSVSSVLMTMPALPLAWSGASLPPSSPPRAPSVLRI